MNQRDKIAKILNDSQEVTFNIDEGINELKRLLLLHNLNDLLLNDPDYSKNKFMFIDEFIQLIQNLLILPQSAKAHFINQFVIKFLVSLIENEEEIKIQKQIIFLILKVFFKSISI
jgi:hypothetical protein